MLASVVFAQSSANVSHFCCHPHENFICILAGHYFETAKTGIKEGLELRVAVAVTFHMLLAYSSDSREHWARSKVNFMLTLRYLHFQLLNKNWLCGVSALNNIEFDTTSSPDILATTCRSDIAISFFKLPHLRRALEILSAPAACLFGIGEVVLEQGSQLSTMISRVLYIAQKDSERKPHYSLSITLSRCPVMGCRIILPNIFTIAENRQILLPTTHAISMLRWLAISSTTDRTSTDVVQ